MAGIKALVLTGYGLNCDRETAHALELAGADAERVHINALVQGAADLNDYRILVFGGGFSWGDDHGAGVIQAVRFKTNLGPRIIEFIEHGNLVIGICNGFQTLVNLGLLPGLAGDYRTRRVALTFNDCGNFRDQWVWLNINKKSPCVFTTDLDRIELPVRHGEGKFVTDSETLGQLHANGQIVACYALPDGSPAGGRFPFNPNGAMMDIAAVCDETGRVFGLMPHPEAFHHPTNHPDWTRQHELAKREGGKKPDPATPGVRIFRNAVEYLRGA